MQKALLFFACSFRSDNHMGTISSGFDKLSVLTNL